MPKKPDENFIKIARKKINPVDVLRAVINDTPELKDAAIASGKFKTVEVPDYVESENNYEQHD